MSTANQTRVLVVAAAFAFILKLVLAFDTYGTNDVMFWEADIRKIQGDGGAALYREGAMPTFAGKRYGVELFNQPPFMVHAFRAGGVLADLTGIPFRTWLRIATSLADLGILLTLWAILGIEERRSLSRLLPVALSPVLILVSGFHGNTDSLMILFLLLAVYFIERRCPGWAGISFGIAASIKIVPVIFLPVLLFSLSTMRDRFKFAGLSAVVWLAGSMPYLAQDPVTVIHRVFGYSSVPGVWGFSNIASVSHRVLQQYLRFGRPVTLVLCLIASWAVCRGGSGARLFQSCGLIAFLLMFTLSGWGVQYLVWIVPWTAALPWKAVRVHYVLLGLFVVVVYGLWSHWQFWLMNTLEPAPVRLKAEQLLALPLWISTGVMTWRLWCGLPAAESSLRVKAGLPCLGEPG